MTNSKILVSGSAGYLGTILIPKLIQDGYQVSCLDRFSNGVKNFTKIVGPNVKILKSDIREIDTSFLKNIDCVIDLSAQRKSNFGSKIIDTFDVNVKGRTKLAKFSKKAYVKNYIRISGTSVYGQQSGMLDEKSDTFPTSDYSKANLSAEKEVMRLNDDKFNVTCLRLPSVFGYSPRMRWDQAVNAMTLSAFHTNKIEVKGRDHRRPFLHILDFVNACKIILKSDDTKISGELFNVGSNDINYNMESLANEISKNIDKKIEIKLNDSKDIESHAVSFGKIKRVLEFETQYKIGFGVKEIYESLKSGLLEIPKK
jgi:nucleoside-diphosphate-sugar epimerase